MLKTSGAPCPKCNGLFCAEYAQIGKRAQWTCHGCGKTGDLVGDVSLRSKAPEPVRATAKPHWTAKAA